MAERITCPYCHTPNQKGDKYCLECGQPLVEKTTLIMNNADSSNTVSDQAGTSPQGDETAPLSKNSSFLPRPAKAIFGDRFVGSSHIHSDEQQHGYLVTEISAGDNNLIKQCTNPECGAVHVPLEAESENFCTRCSAPISSGNLVLTLFEARSQIFGSASEIARLGLTHTGIRPPVAAFQELVAGEDRFCLVIPYTEPFNSSFERAQVLGWGRILTSAFAYLHENGVTFNGQYGENVFSLSNGTAVIASFYQCEIADTVVDKARVADLRTLSKVLYKWLTGHTQFSHDPGLTPALNSFFKTALQPSGFLTAEDFIQAFDDAIRQTSTAGPVDYKLGRLTDVGVARSLNEDSLLTIQFDKYLESKPDPLGVYVVADGMGGHSAGEVASGAIINTIAEQAFDELMSSHVNASKGNHCSWIERVIKKANKDLYDMSQEMRSDMGSTIVMAIADGNQVCIGHVGDSRAYLINNQGITPLTTDHSLVERLIDTGQISRDEARHHPQRNVIYRTMGDKAKVEVETTSRKMNPGDRLLLCSDGLNGMVEDQTIFNIVMEERTNPQDACEKLIQAANSAGGDDNITVVVLEFV